MAKTKQELQEEAKSLGLEIDAKAKVADAAIKDHGERTIEVAPAETEADAKASEEVTAKAGKRSHKAQEEAAAKQAKEERKASGETDEAKSKAPVKPTRSRLERRGKHFRKSAELIEAGKAYGVDEAVVLAQKTSHVKFDATVEMHIRLNVDPRHADQNIRDSLVLPAGTGKNIRVAVADDTLLAKLDKGTVDFDVLVATPAFMPKLGKYARMLGPRGLMPNPKSGTVTTDVDKAVAEAKAGRVEYRVDSTGIVHLGVGKVSFTPVQLSQNIQAVMASLAANKPQSLKGNYIRSIHLTTSMGPSIALDPAKLN
jgi:ribosomal protein L1